jgi:hypothetical protein
MRCTSGQSRERASRFVVRKYQFDLIPEIEKSGTSSVSIDTCKQQRESNVPLSAYIESLASVLIWNTLGTGVDHIAGFHAVFVALPFSYGRVIAIDNR